MLLLQATFCQFFKTTQRFNMTKQYAPEENFQSLNFKPILILVNDFVTTLWSMFIIPLHVAWLLLLAMVYGSTICIAMGMYADVFKMSLIAWEYEPSDDGPSFGELVYFDFFAFTCKFFIAMFLIITLMPNILPNFHYEEDEE